MDFGRPDYNHDITVDVSIAPEQEPGFLLRGQDHIAARVVHIYAVLAEAEGRWEIARHARAQAAKMEHWLPKKMPDL
jgi:hypothetical protein